jgi:hypothetical protein
LPPLTEQLPKQKNSCASDKYLHFSLQILDSQGEAVPQIIVPRRGELTRRRGGKSVDKNDFKDGPY